MGDNKDRRNYTNGGIVNIISPAFQNDFIAYSSHLFNKDAGSNNTRYYYNLFGTSLAGEASFLPESRKLNGANLVIADADQMMIWHLSQYINDSLRRYLKPYFVGEAIPAKNTGITIRGTIDLNNRGYYPTPVGNCTIRTENAATIIFHGDKLTNINGWLTEKGLEGEGNRRENYMLHSGLLVSPGGGVTVQGNEDYLTLQGKITRSVRVFSSHPDVGKVQLQILRRCIADSPDQSRSRIFLPGIIVVSFRFQPADIHISVIPYRSDQKAIFMRSPSKTIHIKILQADLTYGVAAADGHYK